MANVYQLPTITVAPSERFTSAYLASNASMDERVIALSGLLSTLSSPMATTQQAVALTLSAFATGVPEVAQVLGSLVSTPVDLKPHSFGAFYELLNVDASGSPNQAILPIPGNASSQAALITGISAVYSGLALLLFAIGRQARESAPTAASVNRPSALIRRYTLSDSDQQVLPGRALGPTVQNLERIYNAFSVYSEARAAITRSLLAIERATPHPPTHIDPLLTQLRLMRNSGMTHVDAIFKLAQAHPWTVRLPKLEPYYKTFCRDLGTYAQIPADVRQYHRLLAPPGDFLFLTSELRPLIAVAGDFVEGVESTFSGYVYNKTKYQQLIKEVAALRPGYEPISKLANLALQLDLDEIPAIPSIETKEIPKPSPEM